MRVLCLTPYLPPPAGGIEKELLAVAGELVRLGHQVHVLGTTARFPAGENPAPPPGVPEGVVVERLRGRLRSTLRGFAPARAPLVIPGLRARALAARPDLVLVFNAGWGPPLRPVLEALRGRAPVLYRTYFHPPGGVLRPLKTRYILRTVAIADRAFVATRSEAEALGRTGHLEVQAIAVVPPGVHVHDEDAASGESPLDARGEDARAALGLAGKTVIAHTARLSEFKGTGDLVRALPEVLRRTGEDVALLLIGPGGEPFAELARSLGVGDRVRLVGEVSDDRRLRALLRAAHLFALPSAYEAFGIAYIEALAEGLPCVGCDVGGVREAVGEEGVLIGRFGDLEALAGALAALVLDRDRRADMGRRGRSRVRSSLTWRHTAERLLRLAAEVRGEAGAAAGLAPAAASQGAGAGAQGRP